MNYEVLEVAGKIAGVAGLSIGAMLLTFKEIIRKKIFPTLTKQHAYKTIRLMIILVWSIAVLGISAWVYSDNKPKEESKALRNLEAILSLDSLNHSIYLELKGDRIDLTKDTYQNLQLIRFGVQPQKPKYISGVSKLRTNNEKISNYLLEIMSEVKTSTFKRKAEQFIQHAGMVDTRYESAMQSDSISNLPEITISYPNDFRYSLKEEIKSWRN